MPEVGLSAASPLYLIMPEVERKKTELSIKETSGSKSRAKMLVVREPGSDEKVIGEPLKQC